jgi:hypothetical protein
MTDPSARQAVAGLYTGEGWPAAGDELLAHSLSPRSHDMLLEVPARLDQPKCAAVALLRGG